MIKSEGSALFRQRVCSSILSGKTLVINKIREKKSGGQASEYAYGLQDYEASFLRLVEQLTDGLYCC